MSKPQKAEYIHTHAIEIEDESIISNITTEGQKKINLIDGMYRYHQSCMKTFMNKTCQENPEATSIYERCFMHLANEITDRLLNDGVVYSLKQLTTCYQQLLQKEEVPHFKSYRVQKLKNRLERHFGNRVQFLNLNKKGLSTLICASHITIKHMCSEVIRLRGELEDSEILSDYKDDDTTEDDYLNINNQLYTSAKCLRNQIRNIAKKQRATKINAVEPYTPFNGIDVSNDGALSQIPNDLYNYLGWLLSDTELTFRDDGKLQIADNIHEKVINLAQDIMFNTAYVALPKHVGLALHLLKEARAKSLITILNRLGNAISYADAQRYVTTAANEVDQQIESDGFFIPTNLKHGCFIQSALDNLDFSENTKDGTTTHATTHIVYQYSNEPDQQTPSVRVALRKDRNKAIAPPADFEKSECTLSIHDRRQARLLTNIQEKDETLRKTISHYETENFIWHLLRMFPTQLLVFENDAVGNDVDSDYQIPSWNKFFDNLHERKEKTVVAYGPMFPEPPTSGGVV